MGAKGFDFLAVFGLKVISLQTGSLCGKKEEEELGGNEPAYSLVKINTLAW